MLLVECGLFILYLVIALISFWISGIWWDTTYSFLSIALSSGVVFIFLSFRQLEEQQDELLKIKEKNTEIAIVGQAAGTLTHLIRNPLINIDGNLQQLNDATSDKDFNRIYMTSEFIAQDILKVHNIIQQLAKIPVSGIPKANYRKCNLGSIIEEVLGNVRKPQISIDLDIKQCLFFVADEKLLKQVFRDMINNAFEAFESDQRGIIKIKAYKIDTPFKGVCIEIRDNGRGIPKKYHDSLFTPFFTTKRNGTGLGLWIAKLIIEDLHQGNIFIQSKESEGTNFEILLPKLVNSTKEGL